MTHIFSSKNSWVLRKIEPELKQLDQIPLFGKAPSFDWERFSSLAASRFGVQNFSIYPSNQEWRTSDSLCQGLGNNICILPIDLSPLKGTLYWMMTRKDIAKLTAWMLNGKEKPRAITSDILQEGFYRYLLLEAIDAASELDSLKSFTPILHEEAAISQENAFCIDVQIDFDNRSCSGRLAISNELRLSWLQHFNKFEAIPVSSPLIHNLELVLSVQTGSVFLQKEEWENLKIGDFVLLDRGGYDPKSEGGLASLYLGTTPLFQVKIKHNKIHLLDYAFIYEDSTDMNKNIPPEDSQQPPEEALPQEEGDSVTLKELPLSMTVELARIRITLEKLMQLAPGNLLELPIQPDQGVALTVNGQKVGSAELVHLGENLGIRILELG
jgi:flagellar motor switch protein FliN/FliY